MSTHSTDSKDRPIVVRRIEAVRAEAAAARLAGRRIALVPTMGALHAGHASLIDAARGSGAFTVVSIFVNPTQFGPREDFDRYPRTLEADVDVCRRHGVDVVFAPERAEMYPPGDQTRVGPGALAEGLCGALRPGHFEGVCTVVAKLFNIVGPDAAYFGKKDAQQAGVIRRMVEDLCFPIRIEVLPIVREADGLAMSSRNAGLSPADRRRALCLYRALSSARDLLMAGHADIDQITRTMQAVAAGVPGVQVDYMSVVDPESFTPIFRPQGQMLLAGAIRVGSVRLIDNLDVDLPMDRT